MKIHNFRLGFATNSSSSHSVVMIPPDKIGKVGDIDAGGDDFNWEFFRLTTEEAKMRYLAAQFMSNFRENSEVMQNLVERFSQEIPHYRDHLDANYAITPKEVTTTRYDGTTYTYTDCSHPSVDHQSIYNFSTFDATQVDQLIAAFKNPRLVVLGGNDNTDFDEDQAPNSVRGADRLEAFNDLMTDGSKVRVKIEGDYWCLFSSSTGTKSRISFNEDAPAYVKSITPELVDVKITDYCGRGCNFCYQSSTKHGVHGSLDKIDKLFAMLGKMGVFEVAIGGGEPTDHPDFAKIIESAVSHDLVPNFTTLSDAWLHDADIMTAVANVGGIGVSCSDKKALALAGQIKNALSTSGNWNTKVSAQHVLGSVPIGVTAELIEAAFEQRIPLLLLGFKEVGFGAAYLRHDGPETAVALALALDTAKQSHKWAQLSVDTALVDQYPDILTALNVPNVLVTSPEGKFSCYVDAVDEVMGPSSYVEKAEMTPVCTTVEDFKVVYATY